VKIRDLKYCKPIFYSSAYHVSYSPNYMPILLMLKKFSNHIRNINIIFTNMSRISSIFTTWPSHVPHGFINGYHTTWNWAKPPPPLQWRNSP